MALVFPISASIGQTYQSGSSPIYTYNGSVWTLSQGNVGISELNAFSASLKQALQITGSNTTMLGNLNVQGTQTALNQASLQITDKFIRVASGSLSSAQSNGAGLIIDGANVTMSWDSSNSQITFNTQISASKYYGDGSGLTGVSSYSNSDNLSYLNSKGVISGSSQVVGILSSLNTYTGSNDSKWTTIQNVTSSLISATGSYETKGRGIISGSSQLTSSFDTRYTLSGSVQPLPSGLISGSFQLTSSLDARYLTIGGDGVISGSSQLTASYDTRYTLSGSVVSGTTPAGTVSGSSQLTSSLDLRYLVTGSVTSSILQLNTFTASNANTSLNTFTSSLNIWTSSVATTGSNSFNGNQTITGSLNVSSVAVISSSFTANSSSLTLNSGSNFYLQNNGIAEISGSLRVSGSLALTGSISISSGSITMPNRPAFRVYGLGGATTATTILSGSMTIVDYNQGGWNNTTGTFTAPIAGLYQVNLVCRTNSNSSAQSVQVIVYKNNTTISPSPNGTAQIMVEWAANTTTNHIGSSTISKLAVGDTLKAIVTVGTASFDGNDNFSVAYIG